VIQGNLEMSTNGTRTLNVGNGLSVALTFAEGTGIDVDPAGVPTTINTFGAPYAVSGNQVVVVDPTSLAMQDEVVTDLTNNISNAVFQAIGAARTGAGAGPGGPQPMFLSSHDGISGSPETALRYWGKAFGSRREQDGDSPSVDAEHWIIGTVSGVDAAISANTRAGGFLGGSTGEVDVAYDSQETEIDSFFGGLYVGSQMGAVSLDFAVMGGWTDNELERKVANNVVAGGIQTAAADYDGYFIAPEVAVGVETGIGLVPSARLRYVNYQLDGYRESGAAGNFTVADREIEILQGRFQIAAPIVTAGEDSAYTRIEPYAGVEFRSVLSGDNVDAVLLGQSLSFDPGGDDDVTSFFAGLTGSARIAGNIELFGNVEANFEDEGSYRFGGNVGAKVTF
jgi:outer membrane autotransporter protein